MTIEKIPLQKFALKIFNLIAALVQGSQNEISILNDLDRRLKSINQILIEDNPLDIKVKEVASLIEPAFNFITKIVKSDEFIRYQYNIIPAKGIKKVYNTTNSSLEVELMKEDLIQFSISRRSIILNTIDIQDAVQEYIKLLDSILIEKKPASLETKSKVVRSYNWLGRKDVDLGELHRHLISEHLILKNTTKKQIFDAFNNSPLESINPISWHDDNASEILFFIKTLIEKGLIKNEKRMNYERLRACFVKPDGRKFNQRFKDLNKNVQILLAGNKQEVIQILVSKFT